MSAFSNDSALTTATIYGDGNTVVGTDAFMNCSALKELELNDVAQLAMNCLESMGVETAKVNNTKGDLMLGYRTFGNKGSTALKSVEASATGKLIIGGPTQDAGNPMGYQTFGGCSALESVKLSGTIEAIGQDTFSGCTSLTTLDMPFGDVAEIGANAFYNCSSLASLVLSNATKLAVIGTGAFRGCEALESISFDGCTALNTLGATVFYNCTSLKSLNLSDTNFATIPANAFRGCTALESLTFNPDVKLTDVGSFAFAADTALATLRLPNGELAVPMTCCCKRGGVTVLLLGT